MIISNLELLKVEIGKFYPSKEQVELLLTYDDGNVHKLTHSVFVSDASVAAESIISLLKKNARLSHEKVSEVEEGQEINIVMKDEEERKSEVASFIDKLAEHMNSLKGTKVAEGYLDKVRDLKHLKLYF